MVFLWSLLLHSLLIEYSTTAIIERLFTYLRVRMSDLDKIATYYTQKIKSHGASAKGVDWNSKESQYIRFDQITRVFKHDLAASIVDLGCGYGEYYKYLTDTVGFTGEYLGVDLSDEMVRMANQLYGDHSNFNVELGKERVPKADYIVASGIFSVKLSAEPQKWQEHINNTILKMFESSSKGISFNCLTLYSDSDRMRDDLYYASPEEMFRFCKMNLSKDVALLHDYNLYEFTINVTKD